MDIKKLIGIILMGAAFCLLLSAPSFAATINPGDTIQFSFATPSDRVSGFGGGAFQLVDGSSSYVTYCLETIEYINLGANYTVESVSLSAIAGGVGNTGGTNTTANNGSNSDPISSQTAYLYYMYATGQISGITANSGIGTALQQEALQYVFWYLENEILLTAVPSDILGLFNQYITIANSDPDTNQYYNVYVVNPIDSSGNAKQSQLVYVPEAGSLLLFGSGLVGLVLYRRKQRMR